MTSIRIDAHHHFWDPARYDYYWMEGAALDPVRRAYGPDDLRPHLEAAGITGTVLVQTIFDLAETEEFLAVAAATDFVKGVVGWVDLTSPEVGADLDRLIAGAGGRFLVGIRHQVHDEPDPDWLRRDDVRHGLTEVQARGLTYDLLLRSREIPAAVDTVAELPSLSFVLDHIAKPTIAAGSDHEWMARMPALAALPNVTVKLSGMVTEASWETWTPDDLRPYVDAVLDWFGPDRVMFGSDWPVCELAGGYDAMRNGLLAVLDRVDDDNREALFGRNAARVYGLGAERMRHEIQ